MRLLEGAEVCRATATGMAAIDCLLCHSSSYDYRQRKPFKDEKGRVVMGQDRSVKAAMAVGIAQGALDAAHLPHARCDQQRDGKHHFLAKRGFVDPAGAQAPPRVSSRCDDAIQAGLSRFHRAAIHVSAAHLEAPAVRQAASKSSSGTRAAVCTSNRPSTVENRLS